MTETIAKVECDRCEEELTEGVRQAYRVLFGRPVAGDFIRDDYAVKDLVKSIVGFLDLPGDFDNPMVARCALAQWLGVSNINDLVEAVRHREKEEADAEDFAAEMYGDKPGVFDIFDYAHAGDL